MKILMISTDPLILTEGTSARQRMEDYASIFDELHIVLILKNAVSTAHYRGLASIVGGNLFLYSVGGGLARRLIRAWRIGRGLSRRVSFDVISAQGPDETGLLGFLLARRMRTIFQLQIHTDIMSPYYRRAGWKERLRYWIARFLVSRGDCIRAVSQRIAKSLCQTGFGTQCAKPGLAQKTAVLPIFTDASRYADAAVDPETERRFKNYDFKMLAVGRFVDREKNFSMLIDLMCEFVKICPSALLVLVGDGSDRESYKLQVSSYKLEKNIVLEPWRDDLSSFYKSFELFLLSSNYEGWGRAVVEAMASGLAVVMTDVGLAGEVVKDGENGRIVPVGDKEAMLSAIAELYKNPQKRKELAIAGQETARDLRPKTKEEYLALYKKSFVACGI